MRTLYEFVSLFLDHTHIYIYKIHYVTNKQNDLNHFFKNNKNLLGQVKKMLQN